MFFAGQYSTGFLGCRFDGADINGSNGCHVQHPGLQSAFRQQLRCSKCPVRQRPVGDYC